MHEFSIGERIIGAVLAEIARRDPASVRLCKVRIVVGALHQIVPDYLTHAYAILSRGTVAEGSVASEDTHARRTCESTWTYVRLASYTNPLWNPATTATM